MKWDKKFIDVQELPMVNLRLAQALKEGQGSLDTMRCVFKRKEDSVLYMYTVFDWIDAKISPTELEKFAIYQPFNEN